MAEFIFDPFSDAFKTNPYPIYLTLREKCPVCWQKISEQNSFWFISKYEDVDSILKDSRFVREFKTVFPENSWTPPKEQKELFDVLQNWVLFRDPPAHTRLRKNISIAFQNVVSKKIEARILKCSQHLLKNKGDSFDVVNSFAIPLPVMVFADILGLPAEDWKRLKEWSDLIVKSFDISKNPNKHKKIGHQTVLEMKTYFSEWINEKKRNPKNDLISNLLKMEKKEGGLAEHEIMANLIFLLGAGHETTTNLIGNGVLALLQNPQELKKLQENPRLINNAIEEFLRYDSPIQMTFRIASEDLDIKGQNIKKGQQVALLLGSANRDEDEFEAPDILNIERKNANKHLAFATGIHYCVGANLAKLEALTAIKCLVKEFDKLTIVKTDWKNNPSFRTLSEFKVSVN